jgi:hypothetical protein
MSHQDLSAQKTLIIACGALAKETRIIIDRRGWSVDLKAIPALYHMTPPRIVRDLDLMLAQYKDSYAKVVVVYGECGTANIDDILAKYGVVRVSGPHCYEMYAGTKTFDTMMEDEPGTFFLTDWLLRAYEKAVLRGLGLDKHPELVSLVFGNYRRLVYLSQFPDEKLLSKARAIAEEMGWSFEHRHTGVSVLEERLAQLMGEGALST